MTRDPPTLLPRSIPDEGRTDETMARAAAISLMRGLIQAQSRPVDASPVLPFGIVGIDAHLPGRGLGLGRLHEIAPDSEADGPAALGFILAIIARHLAQGAGEAILVLGRGHPAPYGHGLVDFGLDPARLLLLEVDSDTDAYRAVEESLSACGLRAVAGLVNAGLPLKPSRRLHLAAGRTGKLMLILRPPGTDRANVAATRWRIAVARGARDRFDCLVRPRWLAHLDRCRNGMTGRWLVEWDHAAHRFDLAGALADHPLGAGGERGAGCI